MWVWTCGSRGGSSSAPSRTDREGEGRQGPMSLLSVVWSPKRQILFILQRPSNFHPGVQVKPICLVRVHGGCDFFGLYELEMMDQIGESTCPPAPKPTEHKGQGLGGGWGTGRSGPMEIVLIRA